MWDKLSYIEKAQRLWEEHTGISELPPQIVDLLDTQNKIYPIRSGQIISLVIALYIRETNLYRHF